MQNEDGKSEGEIINEALKLPDTDELDVGAIHGTFGTSIYDVAPTPYQQARRFLSAMYFTERWDFDVVARLVVEFNQQIIAERDHFKKVAEDLLDTRLPAHIILGGGTTWEKVYYSHLEHVQKFLKEMWQTMADPVEDFKGNVEALCAQLLKIAREQREELNDR